MILWKILSKKREEAQGFSLRTWKNRTSFCLEMLEFLGPNCNENEVYNVAFMREMFPSESIEDSVQKMGRCPWI